MFQISDFPGLYSEPNSLQYLGSFFFIVIVIIVILWLLQYVYLSLTLMLTARKLKVQPEWLAWIPFANIYLKAKMAKMHWWPLLFHIVSIALVLSGGFLIFTGIMAAPFVFESDPFSLPYLIPAVILIFMGFITSLVYTVFHYIWEYKICEFRNRPGWWALVPLLNIVIPFIFLPLELIPVLGILFSLIENMLTFAISVWYLVYWGIIAFTDQ